MKIINIEGWQMVGRRDDEDGKLLEGTWSNKGAGYDTATVYVKIARTSIREWNKYSVIVKASETVFARKDSMSPLDSALKLAYGFMRRNKNIVRLK